jgi:dihydrofolate reductase
MAKVILYSATTIDGFIAQKDGGIDFLHDERFAISNEDFGYQEFYDSISTTLMGNNTYQQVLDFDVPFPYPDKKNYVFSKSQKGEDENVTYINSDIATFVNDLKSKAEKDVWLVGGGQINTLLLEAGLIDEIIITLIPVILGEGIPLFPSSGGLKRLNLVSEQAYENGFVKVTYSLFKV